MWEDALADQCLRHEWGSWRKELEESEDGGAGEFILKMKMRMMGVEDRTEENNARGALPDHGR